MKRKVIFKILIPLGFVLAGAFADLALATSSAVQVINIPVAKINAFTINGNPSDLVIDTAIAGRQPLDEVNVTTTYSISTNETNKKITGRLDCDMPNNTYLKIRLEAPRGATSIGDVILSTKPADLVTGITKVAESGKKITYTFSSTEAAGLVKSGRRIVTLTVTN